MKDILLKETKINKIRDYGKCSNVGGIDLDGKRLFTIKTRKDNAMSAISVYPDYRKTKRTTHKFANCLHHGNDLTYFDGRLYVAPCDKYVEVINVKTWGHTRLPCDTYVSAITHYTGNQFIALTRNSGTAYTLSILRAEGSRMKFVRSWGVKNPLADDGYIKSQGLSYKKSSKQIYIVFANQDYLSNVILRSGLDKQQPNCIFRSRKAKTNLYEFEGITFNSSGSMLIGANRGNGDILYTAR